MKDNQIMRQKLWNRIKPFLALTTLFIAGCAGDPVHVQFPISHPANPEANEAEFILPQNPFQTDFTAMERKTTSDSAKTHQTGSKQSMDHGMGHMQENQSESRSGKNPPHMDSGKKHQEHNQ